MIRILIRIKIITFRFLGLTLAWHGALSYSVMGYSTCPVFTSGLPGGIPHFYSDQLTETMISFFLPMN
jgi:hypothetical protein